MKKADLLLVFLLFVSLSTLARAGSSDSDSPSAEDSKEIDQEKLEKIKKELLSFVSGFLNVPVPDNLTTDCDLTEDDGYQKMGQQLWFEILRLNHDSTFLKNPSVLTGFNDSSKKLLKFLSKCGESWFEDSFILKEFQKKITDSINTLVYPNKDKIEEHRQIVKRISEKLSQLEIDPTKAYEIKEIGEIASGVLLSGAGLTKSQIPALSKKLTQENKETKPKKASPQADVDEKLLNLQEKFKNKKADEENKGEKISKEELSKKFAEISKKQEDKENAQNKMGFDGAAKNSRKPKQEF